MTKLLDDALAAIRNLPSARQDEIARAMFRLTGTDVEPPIALSPDERAAIAASKAAFPRSEFGIDDQVRHLSHTRFASLLPSSSRRS